MRNGLARLADLENANSKRVSARLLRANAGKYTAEREEIRAMYQTVETYEQQAKNLRGNKK